MRPDRISLTALPVTPLDSAMDSMVLPFAISPSMIDFQSIPKESTGYCRRSQQHSVTDFCNHRIMDTVGKRVRRFRERKRITRPQLAELSGVGYSTIAELENGGMKSTTKLRQLADAMGANVVYLETGEGDPEAPPTIISDDAYTDVLAYAQAAGLSDGEEMAEYAETYSLKFKRSSLDRRGLNAANCTVFYGKGDSMLPDIKDGAVMLIDTSKTRPVDGGLFVILVPGINGSNYSVKRCIEVGGEWWFDALNPDGEHAWKRPRKMENKHHPIQIIGKVEWVANWVD